MNSAIPAALSSISPTCLIPGCDGYGHADGVCETTLDCLNLAAGEENALNVTVNTDGERPVEMAVWQDWNGDLLRTSNRAEAHAFADQLRAFAAAVDKGAALLARSPIDLAKPEPVDYAARFAALDSDVLFDVEEQGDSDDARNYVESLLIVLTEWRTRVVGLLAETPAEWAVPEVSEYQRAMNRTREAWLQYSFRWQGGPDLPYPFDLPEPVPCVVQETTQVARIVSAGRRDLVVREVAAA